MTIFTKQELVDSSEHLVYEIEMFRDTCVRLTGRNVYDVEANIRANAFLESFLVHTRLLIDFFYTPPRDDDIAACHYFDSEQAWKTWEQRQRPVESELLKKSRKAANKRLMHFTKDRKYIATVYQWEFSALYAEIVPIVLSFGQHIPQENVHQDFLRLIGKMS